MIYTECQRVTIARIESRCALAQLRIAVKRQTDFISADAVSSAMSAIERAIVALGVVERPALWSLDALFAREG